MGPEAQDYVARFWDSTDTDRVVCRLCPRGCVLAEGQRGFCFVRQNRNGQLVLTTYGCSSGFCVDPIEKKPLYHFYPGTGVLSFGTAGCNLGCRFCQNWDLSRSRDSHRMTEAASPSAIAQTAKELGCKSVALTYNDPVVFAEYAIDTARACQRQGVRTVAVTAGYITDTARPEFFEPMAAANVDLKSFSEKFYVDFAAGHLQPVLDTLLYLRKETAVWLEITNLLIPGANDSEEELQGMTRWINNELGQDVPVHFSAFHPAFRMTNYPATPLSTLQRARQIALANGLRYVYTGNVQDEVGGHTYCHHCGRTLIERDWYEIGAYHLRAKNQCAFCGSVCAGHFDERPGEWGSRRLPVRPSSGRGT